MLPLAWLLSNAIAKEATAAGLDGYEDMKPEAARASSLLAANTEGIVTCGLVAKSVGGEVVDEEEEEDEDEEEEEEEEHEEDAKLELCRPLMAFGPVVFLVSFSSMLFLEFMFANAAEYVSAGDMELARRLLVK